VLTVEDGTRGYVRLSYAKRVQGIQRKSEGRAIVGKRRAREEGAEESDWVVGYFIIEGFVPGGAEKQRSNSGKNSTNNRAREIGSRRGKGLSKKTLQPAQNRTRKMDGGTG